ncbi:MAG: hypothetical protein EZS28_021882 [Streblomastix strix]|uniref:Uncharacterized protein n=1 Tax=Streblomastix strix TaxID=222440 RepID=A0A5J4VJ24_9EUKA|nr:MAG: hypothetical protein EZS28_021882 [Streblomastix strix]
MRAFENQYYLDPAILPPEQQPESITVMCKRSGIILSEFFRTGLSSAKIQFTGLELNTLDLTFRVSHEEIRIKYLEFIHVVDDAPLYMKKIQSSETQPASLLAIIPACSPNLAEHTVELAQKTDKPPLPEFRPETKAPNVEVLCILNCRNRGKETVSLIQISVLNKKISMLVLIYTLQTFNL